MSAKNLYDKISLYIPPGRPLEEVVMQLRNEFQTANGIKDDETRWNVQETLLKIVGMLRLAIKENKKLPTGVAIWADVHGMETMEPAKPITINLYRCDDHFDKEHIPK